MSEKLLVESGSAPLAPAGERWKIVLITPGRGSSGLYTESVLRRDGPAAWPKGSHSYVDHIEPGEQRSPTKLIGVLDEDAHYEDGVGLVSYLKPMPHWKPFVEAVAPYTGLSIYAKGDGKMVDVDGEEVFMVEQLLPNIVNTVDLVSYAGRGGYVAESLKESAIQQSTQLQSRNETLKEGNDNMAQEDEVKHLISVVEQLVSAQTAAADVVAAEARTEALVSESVQKAVEATVAVESAEVPESFKESLRAKIKEGHYDISAELAAAVEFRKEVLAEAQRLTEGEAGFDSHESSDGKVLNNSVKGW